MQTVNIPSTVKYAYLKNKSVNQWCGKLQSNCITDTGGHGDTREIDANPRRKFNNTPMPPLPQSIAGK